MFKISLLLMEITLTLMMHWPLILTLVSDVNGVRLGHFFNFHKATSHSKESKASLREVMERSQ